MRRPALFWPLAAAAVLALPGCSATRLGYDHADLAMRYMASDYFDLDSAQSEEMKACIARLHRWHRASELPLYAALMRSAAERVARGVTPEDVAWAIAGLRARYRQFAVKLSEEAAPVLATLDPAQIAVLERKLAESNEKYAKEFLPDGEKERERARLKRALRQFDRFLGDLTAEQEARVGRFVAAHERYAVLRFEDRRRWQSEAIALIREYREPGELGRRLAGLAARPEARRSEEFARENARWENDIAQLIVELGHGLSREQRAHAVARMQEYAEDFTVLAGENKGTT